jgi:proline iminopeptidase
VTPTTRVAVPGGEVAVWRGGGGTGLPLLCLHGGPGYPHDYLEELAGLGDRREVIFYDQLGCGASDRPEDVSLWTVERFVAELAAVVEALRLTRYHVFGSSWGGMLAMQAILDGAVAPASLVMAGSPASMPRWIRETGELLDALPADARDRIRALEAAGDVDSDEYAQAVDVFNRRHVCRMDPYPAGYLRSEAGVGLAVYRYMNGPSEFTVTGTLRTWDVTGRLGEIAVPTLVTGGEHDEARPAHLREIAARIPGARLEILEGCSHLCFAEAPDRYRAIVNDFLAGLEAAG